MTFGQFWSICLKQWRLILVCFILVGIGAYVGSKIITPLYQSTALVQVAIDAGNANVINSLLASDQLVQTEATLATSDPVLREVASHYKGLTVDQLAKEVTATPKLNTQLFAIDVLDASPQRAAVLANDIAATLSKQQLQMTHQEAAQANFLIIVQNAQPNSKPVQPNVLLNTGEGLAAGLFLGLLLAVLFERFDRRVRTPEALTELLGWPLLAKVWKSKSEDVFNPTKQNENSHVYRILRGNIELSAIDKPLQSLLITSALPREGKSIVAANLAIFMAKSGKNTLLVDADMHCPVQHTQFGLAPNSSGLS
ncbi:MAG: Wzz/FepE/Etk N-terminal domain-containing protein, partial [Chloroflexota bacterium]|nr:Wzz/FepE/Etk N-terminal domain-containing protein [Chloroflexota bacterium]